MGDFIALLAPTIRGKDEDMFLNLIIEPGVGSTEASPDAVARISSTAGGRCLVRVHSEAVR